MYVTSSMKTRLVEEQKEQALILRSKFCAASDQTLDFLLHINIGRKPFSRFLHNAKIIYEYRYMEKADLRKYSLLLHKPGFPR